MTDPRLPPKRCGANNITGIQCRLADRHGGDHEFVAGDVDLVVEAAFRRERDLARAEVDRLQSELAAFKAENESLRSAVKHHSDEILRLDVELAKAKAVPCRNSGACKGEPHTCEAEAIAAAEGRTDRLIESLSGLRANCLTTYGGGYRTTREATIFRHGMDTVCNVVDAVLAAEAKERA